MDLLDDIPAMIGVAALINFVGLIVALSLPSEVASGHREDSFVLRPSLRTRVVGWVSLAFLAVLLAAGVAGGPIDDGGFLALLVVFGGIVVGVSWAAVVAARLAYELDAVGIRRRAPLMPRRELQWADVVRVQYRTAIRRVVVQTAEGTKLSIDASLTGFPAVGWFVLRFVPATQSTTVPATIWSGWPTNSSRPTPTTVVLIEHPRKRRRGVARMAQRPGSRLPN